MQTFCKASVTSDHATAIKEGIQKQRRGRFADARGMRPWEGRCRRDKTPNGNVDKTLSSHRVPECFQRETSEAKARKLAGTARAIGLEFEVQHNVV